MKRISTRSVALALGVALAAPLPAVVAAQQPVPVADDGAITVHGAVPADLTGMPAGPELDGFISARTGGQLQVTTAEGMTTPVSLSDATDIRGKSGFLGLNRTALGQDSLLNGLPVTVQTVQWGDSLVASRVRLKSGDLQTAAMIRNGTSQRFGEHQVAIEHNAAATEALRGRMGDIDQYNLKGTTNVYFDTGKWQLSSAAEQELCDTVNDAQAMDNALLLVVGYTDSTGDQDFNQELSEKRAGRVVNYLQQQCRWAPYRMLTPTGMAESDPLADNTTPAGRAQNRRVAVNILVSKAVDGV